MRNYYLFFTAIIFICGILLASCGIFKYTSGFFLLALTVIFFLLLFISFKNNYLFLVLVSLLIFFLGLVRYNAFNQVDKDNIKNYTTYNKEKIFIQGEIVSDVTTTKRKESFTLSSIAINETNSWEKTNGLVLVSSYSDKKGRFKYGDIVVLEGFLKVPSAYLGRSNFDYRKYLSKKKVYSILSVKKDFLSKKISENKSFITRCIRHIYSVRQKLDEHIKKHLKSPADSILAAILLGKRENINSALKDSFAKTGTLHILAISGLHVGVIYFALRLILKILKVRNNIAIIFSILFLMFFTIIAGGRASVLRAATMFSIFGFGELLKRKISIFNLVGLSCLIILIVNPNQIFDIGFIFSYIAVLSIISISPDIYALFSTENVPRTRLTPLVKLKTYFLKSVSISIAVWLGLLPITAYFFRLVTPIIVIANIIVVPLLLMVMVSGIFLLTLGYLSGALAAIFSESAGFFIFLMIKGVNFMKDIPFSYFKINAPPMYSLILYYVALLTILMSFRNKKLTF